MKRPSKTVDGRVRDRTLTRFSGVHGIESVSSGLGGRTETSKQVEKYD